MTPKWLWGSAALIAALLLVVALAAGAAAQKKPATAEELLGAALHQEEVEGNLERAIATYKKVVAEAGATRAVAGRALFRMGQCYEKLGDAQAREARKAYERVVREFADQSEVAAQARVRLAALGGPGGAGGLVTRRVLTDASGVYGDLTADGKYISHVDWGTGDVVQFEVASGQTTRITNRGPWSKADSANRNQAFSRDGKQIAYDPEVLSDPKRPVFQLRIRNLDGSGLRTLYSEEEAYVYPMDWSPDAGSILALRMGEEKELTLISTADGSVRVLRSITWPWDSLHASFSPDGRFVAFSLGREGSPPQGGVFLMTADGRNEVVVAGHPAEDQLLGWTPDGRSLVFRSDRSGTWDIWSVHITGGKQQGEPELLKKDFGSDSGVLGFAPDGSLYYKTHTYLGHLYNGEVDLETGKVVVPPAPVTTRYTGLPWMPTWSPDGRNLAYISRPGMIGPGNNILTIRSAATGEERFLSPRLRRVQQISWAPDGRSVIALGWSTDSNPGLFRIDTETSGITKLAGQDRYVPRLCPDGKTLVFVRGGFETDFYSGRTIRKRNLDTGEESEVVKAGLYYDLSPDGREVVFQLDGAVKTVSLNGGEPRELFRGLAKGYALCWTRDGRYIIVQAVGTASSEIWRVPAQGGTPLKLDLSVPKMASFALNPDNRRFAFSVREESKSELWVLEHFLPALKAAGKQ
jgi:Tol biopolymer transport system component